MKQINTSLLSGIFIIALLGGIMIGSPVGNQDELIIRIASFVLAAGLFFMGINAGIFIKKHENNDKVNPQ
jgi:hypothetical protein